MPQINQERSAEQAVDPAFLIKIQGGFWRLHYRPIKIQIGHRHRKMLRRLRKGVESQPNQTIRSEKRFRAEVESHAVQNQLASKQ